MVSLKAGDFSALISPPAPPIEAMGQGVSGSESAAEYGGPVGWASRHSGGAPQGVGGSDVSGRFPLQCYSLAAWESELLRRYYLQKVKLGEGSFGTVWRAVDRRAVPFGGFFCWHGGVRECRGYTSLKFNTLPMKVGRDPKGKDRFPTIIFQGLC